MSQPEPGASDTASEKTNHRGANAPSAPPNDAAYWKGKYKDVVELDATKSDFLRLAAHELRRPLTVLRTSLELLTNREHPLPEAAYEKTAAMMRSRILEMDRLIERMLETARLEDNHAAIHPQNFNLVTLAHEALGRIEPLATLQHSIALKPHGPIWVNADIERTATIIDNLLHNAIKYSPRGGQILCEVEKREGYALFTVTDHGIGISADDIPRLFSRFGRIVTDASHQIHGMGLGLYLASSFAKLQGGDILVHSVVGEGSTFSLRIPLALAEDAHSTT